MGSMILNIPIMDDRDGAAAVRLGLGGFGVGCFWGLWCLGLGDRGRIAVLDRHPGVGYAKG